MNKTVINIIVLTLLVSAGFTQNLVVPVKIAKKSISGALLSEQQSYPICGTPRLIPKEQEIIDYFREHPEERTLMKTAQTTWDFNVGDTRSWKASSWVTNDYYDVMSTCRAVGENCYVFVADANWNASIEDGKVDQEAVDAIVNGFDNATPNFPSQGIYDVDVATFGEPPNIDSDDKIIILILDIQDGYDGSGGYIAGYFSPGNQLSVADNPNSNVAEIFYMDCKPANLLTESGRNGVLNTTAHEFQHMIHHRWDSNEISFPNEGLSEIASYVCGYGFRNDSGYRDDTNIYLFNWSNDDALPDYTRAALWTLYLLEQHPNGFLKKLVQEPKNGGDGINQALSDYGAARTWQEIFVDWLIANYLQDVTVDPRWGYAYPNALASTPIALHNIATVSDSGSIARTSGQYVSFKTSIPDTITWTAGSKLSIKAIKIGDNTVVEDVPNGIPYIIKPNGETYSDVTFCIINNSVYTQFNYSYVAKGTDIPVVPGNYELSYEDGVPEGYLLFNTGDSLAVWFDGLAGGKLDSVKTIFRGSGRIFMDISETGTTFLRGAPLMVPRRINIPESTEWFTVDLTDENIDASKDFIVSYVLGSDPSNPAVTVSKEPLSDSLRHSFTYTDGDWNVYGYEDDPDHEGLDGYWNYLIRAYVSVGGVTVLAKPTITSIVANQGDIQLEWNASSSPVEGYNIYRSTATGFTPNSNNKIGSVGNTIFIYTDALPNIQANTDYFYRISSFDGEGNESSFSDEATITTLDIKDNSGIPTEYALNSNYPNPFNPSTTFRFSSPKDGLVKFTVHDLLGRVVYSENRNLLAGNYSFTWNGQNQLDQQVVSGVYFLRMEAEGFSQTRKMLLLR